MKTSRGRRPDARIGRSRAALRAALLDLVAEIPFEDVTAGAITTRAGLGYATFFRHYSSREALLVEIADGLIDELLAAIAPLLAAQDISAIPALLIDFVDERRALCCALLVGAGEAMRREITARAIAAAGTSATSMPPWLPRDLGIIHGVGSTVAILRWWLSQPQFVDRDMIASLLDRLVFAPIAAAPS